MSDTLEVRPPRRIDVPHRTWYDPVFDCTFHSGDDALSQAAGWHVFNGRDLAIDIETPGLDRQFQINCLTAAWVDHQGRTHALLLDPDRDDEHTRAARHMLSYAGRLILHNGMFDMPALLHLGLFDATGTHNGHNKVIDTLLLARMARPHFTQRRDLSTLSIRYLAMADNAGGMKRLFAAAGFKKEDHGWEGMDIWSPTYRLGAMADTVATLRLEPILRDECRTFLTDHPFSKYGASTPAEADRLIATQETVHRVMMRRTMIGINVDRDYLENYRETVHLDRQRAETLLAQHDLEGGAGKGVKLLEYLEGIGELPDGWPRTPKTGKLKATKALLDEFDHPLAGAQRALAETDKIFVYLEKVEAQAAVTGRCHPQVGILGAAATGRMSASRPEYQQFPAAARPIFITDEGDVNGFTSIDWSSIEPVMMGLMAKDRVFLGDFEKGADLYEPLARAIGKPRPQAKVTLLADMYGRGDRSMARALVITVEEAQQLRRQLRSAMPGCTRWMSHVQSIASTHGCIITAAGRILPVDPEGVYRSVNTCIQGSAYDMLAYTIEEMHTRGISDEIYLAMHDEVIVGSEVAEEVREIMQTPPDWLINWAERIPIIRTDMQDLGQAWAKV